MCSSDLKSTAKKADKRLKMDSKYCKICNLFLDTKLFFKTMSSKFFHKAKSPKLKTDITITKSTSKFSDNNLTNTLYSSKNRDNSLFIGLEDFHKKVE